MVRRRANASAGPLTGVSAMVALWLIGSAGGAHADPNCMTRILADAPALEAPDQVKSKRNGTFGPVTLVKVQKQSGQMYYCAGNSYCYGSNAFQFTTPCRLKLDKTMSGGEFFQYSAR